MANVDKSAFVELITLIKNSLNNKHSMWYGTCDTTEAGTLTVDLNGIQRGKDVIILLIGINKNIPIVSFKLHLSTSNVLEKTYSNFAYIIYEGGGEFNPCACDITIKLRLDYQGNDIYHFIATGQNDKAYLENGKIFSVSSPWDISGGTSYTRDSAAITFDYIIVQ